jgi:hypothetical protein
VVHVDGGYELARELRLRMMRGGRRRALCCFIDGGEGREREGVGEEALRGDGGEEEGG